MSPARTCGRIIRHVFIRAEFADELPASIEVRHGDQSYRVQPMPAVEIGRPEAARLLRRHRESGAPDSG